MVYNQLYKLNDRDQIPSYNSSLQLPLSTVKWVHILGKKMTIPIQDTFWNKAFLYVGQVLVFSFFFWWKKKMNKHTYGKKMNKQN